MSPRRHLIGIALGLAVLGCGDARRPPTPPPEPLVVPSSGGQASAQAPPSGADAASTTALPMPRFGEVFIIEDASGDEIERVLVLETSPAARPSSEPLGTAMVHGGGWTLRVIDEVNSPYEEATFVLGPVCRAPILRARRLHGTLALHGDEEATEKTFLALSFTGCETNGYGIVGAQVQRHEIDPGRLGLAEALLVSAIARRDAELAGDVADEGVDPPRAFILPRSNLAIVVGHSRWVLRDGVVVQNGFGRPVAVVEAGPLVLIELDSPSEGWMAALEDFAPWPE